MLEILDGAPSVNALDRTRSRPPSQRSDAPRNGRYDASRGRSTDRPSSLRSRPADTRGRSSDRSTQPRRRPTFLQGVRCDACGTDGHKANTCILTGRVISIMKYCKSNPDLCRQIAKTWTTREAMQRSLNVVQAYLTSKEFSVSQVEAELDVDMEDILGLDDADLVE